MNAMILAAGRGDRLRPLTDETPKALAEIGGTSLLERHLMAVKAAGIDRVVINLGWLGDVITDRIGSGSRFGLTVIYSPEGDNVLETGGGIQRALPLLGDDPFLVVNADVYTDMPYPMSLDADVDGLLVLVPTPDFKSRGDFDVVKGKLKNADSPTFTFSGVAVYRPAFFEGHEPGRFPLAPMLKVAADEDRLNASVYGGLWEDVGTLDRLEQLKERYG